MSPKSTRAGPKYSSMSDLSSERLDSDAEDGFGDPAALASHWILAKDVETDRVFWYNPTTLSVSFENPDKKGYEGWLMIELS